jgi:hypothetical protein
LSQYEVIVKNIALRDKLSQQQYGIQQRGLARPIAAEDEFLAGWSVLEVHEALEIVEIEPSQHPIQFYTRPESISPPGGVVGDRQQ